MRFSIGQQTPHGAGLDHLRRCEMLCRDVDAYSVHLNDPLSRAQEALRRKLLLEADRTDRDTRLFLDAIESRVSMHTKYIFNWSLALASQEAGTTNSLASNAAEGAAMCLQALLMDAIAAGKFDFVILIGHIQLEAIGKVVEDYSVLVSALALAALASTLRWRHLDSSSVDTFTALLRQKASYLIPVARRQAQNHVIRTTRLDSWEAILTLALREPIGVGADGEDR